MPADIAIEPLGPSDRDALLALDQSAFGFDTRDLDPDEGVASIEWDRAFGAHRGGDLAGIYVVYSLGLGVPGSPPDPVTITPMAGLTWVAVHPDHRRRGTLFAMIRHHLHDVHQNARGEAISCLFASESRIYGRFGYGLCTQARRVTLAAKSSLRPLADPGDVSTRFEAADPTVHAAIVKQVYDAECLLRPGHTVRPPSHWTRHLADVPARRPAGAEPLKFLVAERNGEPTGYAVLRRTASWGEHAPEGKVQVNDMHALDSQSAHALWRRLLDFDLIAEVTTPPLAPDDPLLIWADEAGPRQRASMPLWTRIVDVDGALTARGFATDVDVVLDLTDALCPWNAGRWRLTAGPAGSTCAKTTDAADLALDVRELGSVYLGGVTLESLARAGLVDERRPGALAACSTAFRASVLPATPYIF